MNVFICSHSLTYSRMQSETLGIGDTLVSVSRTISEKSTKQLQLVQTSQNGENMIVKRILVRSEEDERRILLELEIYRVSAPSRVGNHFPMTLIF